jgi:hypothetical protein
MRSNIGIRIQRYRLQRYRAPESLSERARLVLTLALAGWAIWALFLSDHSAVRLWRLEARRSSSEKTLAATQAQVNRAKADLKASDDPDVEARVLRERHNFAREGEILYVIQGEDGAVSAPDSMRR